MNTFPKSAIGERLGQQKIEYISFFEICIDYFVDSYSRISIFALQIKMCWSEKSEVFQTKMIADT